MIERFIYTPENKISAELWKTNLQKSGEAIEIDQENGYLKLTCTAKSKTINIKTLQALNFLLAMYQNSNNKDVIIISPVIFGEYANITDTGAAKTRLKQILIDFSKCYKFYIKYTPKKLQAKENAMLCKTDNEKQVKQKIRKFQAEINNKPLIAYYDITKSGDYEICYNEQWREYIATMYKMPFSNKAFFIDNKVAAHMYYYICANYEMNYKSPKRLNTISFNTLLNHNPYIPNKHDNHYKRDIIVPFVNGVKYLSDNGLVDFSITAKNGDTYATDDILTMKMERFIKLNMYIDYAKFPSETEKQKAAKHYAHIEQAKITKSDSLATKENNFDKRPDEFYEQEIEQYNREQRQQAKPIKIDDLIIEFDDFDLVTKSESMVTKSESMVNAKCG